MSFIDPDKVQSTKDALHEKLQTLCDTDAEGCWTYKGTIQETGIGLINVNGRQFSAHRVSAWVYAGDEQSFDLADTTTMVKRACLNERCINWEHQVITRNVRQPQEGQMKLVCPRKTLLDACNLAAPAIARRDIKPVLQNVLLTADADGCRLTATDLEIGIIANLPASFQVESEGMSLWPHARLTKIITEAPDETLTLQADDDESSIKGMHSEFELPGEDAAVYPAVSAANELHHQVNASDLRLAIRRVMFACANVEQSKFGATTGVKWEFGTALLTMVATDGRRLAKFEIKADGIGEREPDKKANFIVPQRAMAMLDRACATALAADENALVQIGFAANDVCFKTPGCSIYSRLVEGRFPAWQSIMPKKFSCHAAIKAGSLYQAIRQAAVMADQESTRVTFRFDDNKVSLKASGANTGKSHVEAACEFDADAVSLAFDPKYVCDMLKVLEPETDVLLEIVDPTAPVLFSVGDYKYVVVPLVQAAAAKK